VIAKYCGVDEINLKDVNKKFRTYLSYWGSFDSWWDYTYGFEQFQVEDWENYVKMRTKHKGKFVNSLRSKIEPWYKKMEKYQSGKTMKPPTGSETEILMAVVQKLMKGYLRKGLKKKSK